MSLQRMFEQFEQYAQPTVTATDSSSRVVEPAGDAGAMTTITFNSPVVQRESEGEASAAAPAGGSDAPTGESANTTPAAGGAAPAAAAAATQGGGGGTGAGGTNVGELVNQLYDPLAARLRAELWLDRERAGVLMNLQR
jgi:hypothetical protein